MEIIEKALKQFLEHHDLLSDAQHGFRSGRSCLTNLLFTLERWTKARDEGNAMHAIYIDFKKVFDSVPHEFLLYKLRNAGIRGRLLVWIQSFLAGRSQRVRVGRQQSSDVSELRQQQAAMMNLYHGQRGMSSSPCETIRFNLSLVGTPEQLDTLTNVLGEDSYRHQLIWQSRPSSYSYETSTMKRRIVLDMPKAFSS
nr:unnamed protein product [Spirometra erinaceieuropaei]